MCFCPQYTEWKTWNENVIKSYANKKCCIWLHKKETVISNTILYLISILTDRISRDEIYLRKVSLSRVTSERISVVLQLLHLRALFVPCLVAKRAVLWQLKISLPGWCRTPVSIQPDPLGGPIPEYGSGDTSTCCFSHGDAREGPRSLLLPLSGLYGWAVCGECMSQNLAAAQEMLATVILLRILFLNQRYTLEIRNGGSTECLTSLTVWSLWSS